MRFLKKGGGNIIIHGAVQGSATAADTVHADTGAILQGGEVEFMVNISNDSSTEVEFSVQRRNAANSATVEQMRVAVATGTTRQVYAAFSLVESERVRVVNVEVTGTGNTQASLFGSHC